MPFVHSTMHRMAWVASHLTIPEEVRAMRVTIRHLVLIGGVLAVPACQDNQQDIAAPRARDVRVSEATGPRGPAAHMPNGSGAAA